MITKAQKVRLGVFFFIGLALFTGFLFIVVGSRLMERLDKYYIAYEDVSVSGLQVGAQVKYHGIKVGRVENISFDPVDVNRVIVEVMVERGTPIREDTEATLILVGITGLKQVELFGGTVDADILEPGSFIKAGTTFFDDISISIESITARLDRVLGNIDSLTSAQNQQAFTNLLVNLEEVSNTSLSAANELERMIKSPEIERITKNTADFTDQIANTDVQGMINELDLTIKQANQTFTHLDLMIIRSRRDILLSLETLKDAIDNLDEFARQISEDPTLILRRR